MDADHCRYFLNLNPVFIYVSGRTYGFELPWCCRDEYDIQKLIQMVSGSPISVYSIFAKPTKKFDH